MWWALETVTTVGYGDVVPVGATGRIIASFLLLGGLAFLTVIIAMITSGFVARYQRQASAAGENDIVQRMEQLSLEIKEIHTEIHRLHPPDTSSKARPRTETADAETRESPALPDH
jgi:voltage-gated potassium channel